MEELGSIECCVDQGTKRVTDGNATLFKPRVRVDLFLSRPCLPLDRLRLESRETVGFFRVQIADRADLAQVSLELRIGGNPAEADLANDAKFEKPRNCFLDRAVDPILPKRRRGRDRH